MTYLLSAVHVLSNLLNMTADNLLRISTSDVLTRRWELERFVAWAVRANLVRPHSWSAVEKTA